MTINKFTKELPLIKEAFEGNTDLRSNKSLYKKICKFYKEQGMIMTGDNNFDYDTILNLLYADLITLPSFLHS
jgi:hypothetical protein